MKASYKTKSTVWLALVVGVSSVAMFLKGIDPASAVLLMGLCFACELIDSGLGMGYGTILTPTLLMMGYEIGDIVPTVLFSELLSGFTAAFFHNEAKNVDLRPRGKDLVPAAILAGGSVFGAVAGVLLSVNLPKDVLNMVVGCIILLSGLFVVLLAQRVILYKWWKMIILSVVASFNKAMSGGGYGPLVTSGQILSGVQGKAAVGITSFAEAFTCLLATTLFLLKGGFINYDLFFPMCAGALVSVPFSVFAISKAKEDHLKPILGCATIILGAVTIYKAVS